ncbi:cytochrome b/b6 domain-containing protein [Paraglaciecola polaris]|uniref:Cytochrome B561 n=1 Tax=Paraglaciecola polaris LMG 21857 TaxID=1129793 RepID=K6ZZI5_9ALTE|nr:cytochrome b/b6 domain-containing protein [Paraglaciecola polaris]GAC34158.1 cytochrome B561 [Paraglaciecola polaris LMG 21857]|tara:strand:+ start:15842 stop:16528 length:687 start_codon:yes stop_codon:yes gene_type:complete
MQKRTLVWDLPLRIFHWALVSLIFAQWLTAEVLEGYMDYHAVFGYTLLGLMIFRLLWGFVGPKHARFNDFLRGPKAIWQYGQSLFSRHQPTYTGHNPLGALIVPAILIVVGTQAVSGLFTTDDVLFNGPYYPAISSELQGTMQWLHHKMFDVLLVIIALHVLAITSYQFLLKKPLIGAMFHGHKNVQSKSGISSSRWPLAIVLALIIFIFMYWLVVIAVPEIELDYYY